MMISNIDKSKKALTVTKLKPDEKKSKIKTEYIPLKQELYINALQEDIVTELKKFPIVIEPIVFTKMRVMMSLVESKLEIFGKMITEIESYKGIKYPCVKDILIPYQEVKAGSFISPPELMGKWMNELNRNTDGTLKPVKEVNELTIKMLGHFHSHDSVGMCSPSLEDTRDMLRNVAGRKYWLEVIGTKSTLSGRVALQEPFNTIISCPVIVKWWQEIDGILEEIKGKVTEVKTTYTYPKYRSKKLSKNDDYYDDDEYDDYFENGYMYGGNAAFYGRKFKDD